MCERVCKERERVEERKRDGRVGDIKGGEMKETEREGGRKRRGGEI